MSSTINQLTFELTNLASESKRRNADIKQASENSLDVLKKFQASSIPEATFLKNLSKNSDFITPFLLSCQTKNPKYISISISCFHRLITSQAIPITKLELVLDAFLESTNLAIEIQLKILQCLPFLFQNYAIFINDKNLFKLLSICSVLQNPSKSNIVNNTASATLSQLINIVFEKINDEDKTVEIDKSYIVPVDNDATLNVGLNAFDGQRIFQDLCSLIEHHPPQFLKTSYITENFGFEILESVLKTNKDIFIKHQELGYLLRTKIVPILLRLFSSSKDFLVLVRASRLILLLVKEQFEILKIETQVILSLLNHILSKDSSSVFWKKILALEIFKNLMTDPNLIQLYFMEFDFDSDSKNKIFKAFWSHCFEICNDNKYLLNTGEVLQAPITLKQLKNAASAAAASSTSSSNGSQQQQQQHSHQSNSLSNSHSQQQQQTSHDLSPGLFVSKSTPKIPFIDLLDKQDPPQTHESYLLYLIMSCVNLFSENCYKHISIDENQNATIDESKANFITALIDQNYRELYQIYEIMIFSTLDQDLFNRLIRSYQKFCQASGMVNLNEARDLFLKLLIKATLNLSGKKGFQYKNSVYSIGESIVGTISSTINQALATTPNQQNLMYSRNINSRHILCFRVVVGLAISLGTVLRKEDWELIFIALQWMDYFIHGSHTTTTDEPSTPAPNLSSQDLAVYEAAIQKLAENIDEYSVSVYNEIIQSIISLAKDSMESEDTSMFNKQPVLTVEDTVFQFQPCSYTRFFYIWKLKEICRIDPRKFLIFEDDIWGSVWDFYFEIISDRSSLKYDLRVSIAQDFNAIVMSIAQDGFNNSNNNSEHMETNLYDATETRVLNSLDKFVSKLNSLPRENIESLVLNCDLEIQSQILDNLKMLLDQFGSNFQHWDLVFNIINSSSFISDKNNQSDTKLKPIIDSSFEALKMILDEFLSSLPSTQLKIAIDCISNFITQQVDLNISLNSISYFWLISDYIRGMKSRNDNNKKRLTEAQELCHLVEEQNDNYDLLYIYLLYTLAKNIKRDPRLQVRNGSIQTFFNIIDSNNKKSNHRVMWNNIYDIIFTDLFTLDYKNLVNLDTLESHSLQLNGFIKLYVGSFLKFDDDDTIKYWQGLIGYCCSLIKLQHIDLNLKVFKMFKELIEPLSSANRKDSGSGSGGHGNGNGGDKKLPVEILESLYKFWISNNIVYNLSQNNLYQESLTALMNIFPILFELITPILTIATFQDILRILNSCVKYPVLPDHATNDNLRATALQEAVYQNFEKLVEFDYHHHQFQNKKAVDYVSLLLQEFASVIVLPFKSRDKIVEKLAKANKQMMMKIPTFISIAHRSIDLIEQQLSQLNDQDFAKLVQNKTVYKIYSSFQEPIMLRAKGITIRQDMWVQLLEILMGLNTRIINTHQSEEVEAESEKGNDDDMFWESVIGLVSILNEYDKEDEFIEQTDIDALKRLYESIQTHFVNNTSQKGTQQLFNKFIKIVFNNSFLLKLNEIDQLLLAGPKEENSNDNDNDNRVDYFIQLLTNGTLDKFNDNTMKLPIVNRLDLHIFNMDQLIHFTTVVDSNSTAAKMLELRLCLSIRKFFTAVKLTNFAPIPDLQKLEILKLLSGYLVFVETHHTQEDSIAKAKMKPIFLKLIKYSNKIDELDLILTKTLEIII